MLLLRTNNAKDGFCFTDSSTQWNDASWIDSLDRPKKIWRNRQWRCPQCVFDVRQLLAFVVCPKPCMFVRQDSHHETIFFFIVDDDPFFSWILLYTQMYFRITLLAGVGVTSDLAWRSVRPFYERHDSFWRHSDSQPFPNTYDNRKKLIVENLFFRFFKNRA